MLVAVLCAHLLIALFQISTTFGQAVSRNGESPAPGIQSLGSSEQPVPPPEQQIGPQTTISHGSITIDQNGDFVTLRGTLSGLQPGQHGFHIYQNGDLRDGCSAAGSHFNPYGDTHGGPNDTVRHVGDLGNIEVGADGNAQILIIIENVSLLGPNSIIGRSLVVHANRDDYGKGGQPESNTTGNSGAQVACGVIGLIDPTPPCSDASSNCASRIDQCNDPLHEKDMIRDCRKTCGHCDCRDDDSRCAANAIWCGVPSARHVRESCRLTCALCNCRDSSNDCGAFKKWCDHEIYGQHINAMCQETCDKCY